MLFYFAPAPTGWRRLIPPPFRRGYWLDGSPVPYWRSVATRLRLALRRDFPKEYEARIAELWRERCLFKDRLREAQAELAELRASLGDAGREQDLLH